MARLPPGPRRPPAIAAVVLASALGAAGCMRPLSVQHEYFSPLNGTVARVGVQTRHAAAHHLALQAAQHACPLAADPARPPAETDGRAAGPDLGRAGARDALAEVCAATIARTPPVSSFGTSSNAYRRSAENRMRPLPAPSETSSSAGGS